MLPDDQRARLTQQRTRDLGGVTAMDKEQLGRPVFRLIRRLRQQRTGRIRSQAGSDRATGAAAHHCIMQLEGWARHAAVPATPSTPPTACPTAHPATHLLLPDLGEVPHHEAAVGARGGQHRLKVGAPPDLRRQRRQRSRSSVSSSDAGIGAGDGEGER